MSRKNFSDISLNDAERLEELFKEIDSKLDEFKRICRQNMSDNEYQQFKYRTLGHIEPAILEDSEWVTKYSSIDSLEKVAQEAMDYAAGDAEEEEEEENVD